MADRTDIPLTEATWNPVTGCSPISPGCRRCYARRFASRLAGRYGYPREHPFAVTVHEERFVLPSRWRKPRHIFVCSMGDLFHADVSDALRSRVFRTMAATPHHTYMVITKRAEGMAAWFAGPGREFVEPLRKALWMGVSAENQARAEQCVPPLLTSWPGLRLVCAEPLLDTVDLSPWLGGSRGTGGVDWVICGGETGSGGVPARPEHVRALRDQCAAAGVPFYLKTWGGPNRKLTGNLIDGRAWEQMPASPQAQTRNRNPSALVRIGALCLAFCIFCAATAAQASPAPAAPQSETAPPSGEAACPLTTPTYVAHLETPEVTGRAGKPTFIRMRLEPPDVPPGFYVTSLAEVVEGPTGATGDRRPRILTGFPAIRFTADVPGVYRVDVRVSLIAKSSCGGVKASPLLEGTVTVRVLP